MKIKPSFAEVEKAALDHNVIPVWCELIADMETPVSAYAKLGRNRPVSFLLESVEGGEKVARYSFIGIDPFLRFRATGMHYRISGAMEEAGDQHPVERLKNLIAEFRSYHPVNLPRFSCGAVGYFGYDTVRLFEKIPLPNEDATILEDIDFGFYRTLVAFDNRQHKLILIHNILAAGAGTLENKYRAACDELARMEKIIRVPLGGIRKSPVTMARGDLQSNFARPEYMRAVDRIKEYVRAGDAFQVVLSQRFETRSDVDPFDLYRCLRMVNPSPYMFFLKLDDAYVVGSSPELLVRVENGTIETRPIAGTRPRGKTPQEDQDLGEELLKDEKERAEHVMLVDLGRNDLGRVCQKGSVFVDEMMHVERYSHVMHIVSSVRGRLEKGISPVDALFACFPAGTLSGAPKIRAMEIISELEPCRRGIYGGALGYIDFSGNLDTCIVIRTLVMKSGRILVQAGAGIVADSKPDLEYEECRNKAKALFRAIEMAESLQDEL